MTKALQERVFIQANMRCGDTRLVCVRYGNVMAARGSVVPLFHDQIRHGGPVTITTTDMTRFMLSRHDGGDTVFAAVRIGQRGETLVPNAPSSRVVDIAAALIGDRHIKTTVTGRRPGEKVHEIMVNDEESPRTLIREKWFAIQPMLPELQTEQVTPPALNTEFSSSGPLLDLEGTRRLLEEHRLLVDQ